MEINSFKIHNAFIALVFIGLFGACQPEVSVEADSSNTIYGTSTNTVKLVSEIDWQKLNPARGDQSPEAGTIYGDRNGTEPTGFLAKFVDGFSSPPHIHNVTYRAVVIEGLIHNDDPSAEKMWMPNGSFWTQPAGEAHITAAKGIENIAYVEIDHGPYLVKPIDQANDTGERPLNIDRTNIVWLDASETTLVEAPERQEPSLEPKIAFLWENEGLKGRLIKLPAGYNGYIKSEGDIFHASVIAGKPLYQVNENIQPQALDPGSYFASTAKSIHTISSDDSEESIIYIRSNDRFSIVQ